VSPVFGHGRLRLYLLKLLDESPRHGYDVIRALEDRFLGLYAPSAGTVYPRLARLETEGLVTSADEDGRKVYRITDAGQAELAARQDELVDIESDITGSVRDLASEIRTDVRGSVEDLRAELRSAARDVRRESRHQARTQRRAGNAAPGRSDLERMAEWFRDEVRDVARRTKPTDADVAALKQVLDNAMDEVRRVLGGTDRR
jgi:DNA-binding PadR family transcriptional regulator